MTELISKSSKLNGFDVDPGIIAPYEYAGLKSHSERRK